MRALFNQVMFPLRNALAWQRPGFTETPEDKTEWRQNLSPELQAQEVRLRDTYGLADFESRASLIRYQENLAILMQLEALGLKEGVLPQSAPAPAWLDVGAQNWRYVDALVGMGVRLHPAMTFLGVEIDGYGIYPSGHSRADAAQAYCAPYPQAQYQVADVLDLTGTFNIVTCFLPFVFETPHLAWGLPKPQFAPQQVCNHLLSLVAPGGGLIVTNQGRQEFEAQEALLAESPLGPQFDVVFCGELPPSFYPYQYPRYGWFLHRLSES